MTARMAIATGLLASTLGTFAFADQDLYERAYIYGLPIIMSYKTMFFYAIDTDSDQYKAPFNEIANTARVYGPQDTAVVSVNSDTPYSTIWLDLRAEPIVLCVPKIEEGRYFSVMVQDLSTNLKPYIGSRSTGNGGGCYGIAGPGWSGDDPEGVEFMEHSRSELVFVAYRTQLFGADDLPNVQDVQKGYTVQPLSEFLKGEALPPQELVEPPEWNEEAATGTDFIKYLNYNLQFIEPSAAESKLLAELEAIGVGAGTPFDFASLDADTQALVEAGVAAAKKTIAKAVDDTQVLAGNTAEGYGDDWLQRAAITQKGWGANTSEEASYPNYSTDADGNPLDGSQASYTITFADGALPPVNFFWSITMYDAETQLMIENEMDRYLLNSTMLDDMVYGDDRSLTLYIQKDAPGEDIKANWLPAPAGPFYMLMRLYGPKAEFLSGSWTPPSAQAVTK